MKNKTLLSLSLIFAVLVGLFLVQTYLPEIWPKSSPYLKKMGTVNKNNLARIEISYNKDNIVLEKDGSIWKLNSAKVAPSAIEALISGLFVTTEPETVAQTDIKHKELEVTPEAAIRIKLSEKTALLIGKANYPGVFARFDDDNTVYLLKELDQSQVATEVQPWLDKTVFAAAPDKIQKLTFTKESKDYFLVKKYGKWLNRENGKEVSKEKTDALLAQLSNLNARSVVIKDTPITGFAASPELKVVIALEGGTETLELSKGKDIYLVKRLSDGQQFLVAEASLSKLLSAPEELF